jgi:hypothetical protein
MHGLQVENSLGVGAVDLGVEEQTRETCTTLLLIKANTRRNSSVSCSQAKPVPSQVLGSFLLGAG